jgi:Flp pilus assembly protein CpaB
LSTQQRVDFRDARPDPAIGASANGVRIGGERLPRPPGRRRPGLALLAVLLIVLGGAVAGLLALRVDQRQDVLVARSDIPAGQQITADDLAVAKMAAEGISSIPAGQTAEVVGRYAATTISAGRLIDPGLLTTSSLLTPGRAAVGIALKSGRYPAAGLQSGDVVQLVRAADGIGKTLTSAAVVSSVREPGEDSLTTSGGDVLTISVIVNQGLAAQVAAASAADQISVVLLRRGGGG